MTNIGGTPTWEGDMLESNVAAGDLGTELGWYGVDTTTNTAWAVLNHNGQFAVVVPEPSALVLISVGLIVMLCRVWSRRRHAPG